MWKTFRQFRHIISASHSLHLEFTNDLRGFSHKTVQQQWCFQSWSPGFNTLLYFVLELYWCDHTEAHRHDRIIWCGDLNLLFESLSSCDCYLWLHGDGTVWFFSPWSGAEGTSLLSLHFSRFWWEDGTDFPACHFTQQITEESKAFSPWPTPDPTSNLTIGTSSCL